MGPTPTLKTKGDSEILHSITDDRNFYCDCIMKTLKNTSYRTLILAPENFSAKNERKHIFKSISVIF